MYSKLHWSLRGAYITVRTLLHHCIIVEPGHACTAVLLPVQCSGVRTAMYHKDDTVCTVCIHDEHSSIAYSPLSYMVILLQRGAVC